MEAAGNVQLSCAMAIACRDKLHEDGRQRQLLRGRPTTSGAYGRAPPRHCGPATRATLSGMTTGSGKGAAARQFEGEGRYRLPDATYLTCTPAAGRIGLVRAHRRSSSGLWRPKPARHATRPCFPRRPDPAFALDEFSLNHERKSGLLTPTFGSTSQGGAEYTNRSTGTSRAEHGCDDCAALHVEARHV